MITLVLYGAFVSSASHFLFSLAFLVGSRPSSGVGAAPTDLKYTIVFVLLGALPLVVDCSLCRVFVICVQGRGRTLDTILANFLVTAGL